MRRLARAAAILAAVLTILTPSALAAYPPGTFPGAAPGGAFRTVVMSKMICDKGGSLQASYDQSALIVQVPARAFSSCLQVSLYAAETGVIAPLLPDGAMLLDSFAVGWGGAPASAPLTLTIYDSTIRPDAAVFETTPTGVSMLSDVKVDDGAVTVSFKSPPGYVVTRTTSGPSALAIPSATASTAAPPAATGPGPGDATPLLLAALVAGGVIAGLVVLRSRRSRGLR